jgi:hypothetical protein
MVLTDVIEMRLYTIMLSGGAQAQAWKGSWSNLQINAAKVSPPIASDLSLQLTLKALTAIYSAVCTFTNGSANITLAANPLGLGDVVQFSNAGGALPTNFVANTNYFVVTVGSPFTVSATLGGTAIVAGSAGTGTQTARRVSHTFPWKLLRV